MTQSDTLYLAGGVEELTTAGSTTTTTKYYSASGLLIGVSVNGTISYLAQDGLGSVSVALSSGGSLTAAQLFAPYGGVRYSSGTMPTARGFTGQYGDGVSGLDYFTARYYDPVAGQFTTADSPKGGQGPNRYAYVLGNPETHTDPTGHCGGGSLRDNCGGGGGSGGGGGTPPTTGKQATCDQQCQLDQRIRDTFHVQETQDVLMYLVSTDIGRRFLNFLLAIGAILGDAYITWVDLGSGVGGYTDPFGNIQLNSKSSIADAAAALVHEAVESYYAIVDGIRGPASQHMDYVAQWFAGEFEAEKGGYTPKRVFCSGEPGWQGIRCTA